MVLSVPDQVVSQAFILKAVGLSQAYGNRSVLKDIDLSLHSHQILLLTGPNGSGKTTLLKVLAGLLRPLQGEVVRGERFQGCSLFTPQTALYEDLSVRENLLFYRELAGSSSELVESLYEEFELRPFLRQRVGRLSWGQRIRAGLARAFLQPASVYLLDEPLTGLDQASQERLIPYFAKVRDAGGCLVISSHLLDPLRSLADGEFVLKDGRLEEGKGAIRS